MEVAELLRQIENGTSVTIIDVRSREEFSAGHIDHAINIPLAELNQRHHEIPKNTQQVITACGKGGGRSEQAAIELQKLGLASARSLCGGTQSWISAKSVGVGMPITEHPLHRSRRALLMHRAPALGFDAKTLQGIKVMDFRRR